LADGRERTPELSVVVYWIETLAIRWWIFLFLLVFLFIVERKLLIDIHGVCTMCLMLFDYWYLVSGRHIKEIKERSLVS